MVGVGDHLVGATVEPGHREIARHLEPADRIATHNLNVTYVAFTRDRVLRCHARVVSLRRTVATAEGEVIAGDGVLVAKALGTFGLRRQRPSDPAA